MINIIFLEFPITGPLRIVSLVMEWIFVFFSLELGILFLIKYIKQPKQLKNSQDLGFSALFYGFYLMRMFFLIADYYSNDIIISPFLIWSYGNYRNLFLNLGFLSIMIAALFFIVFMENYKKFLFKKFFFTVCFSVQLSIFLIIFFFSLEIAKSLSILSWPLFILFFIIYVKDFGKKSKEQEIISKGALKMTLILALILGGYILSMELIIDTLDLVFRLIGINLQLIAIGLIFIFFRKFPPFFEYDWQNKIENICIMNQAGLCLYNYSFTDSMNFLESQFKSGALTSVNIMLSELIGTLDHKLSVIKKKGKIVTIFSSDIITGVLISKEELKYFQHNLKKLILKVEKIYKNVLIDWDGDLAIFYPIKNIIDDIFSI